MPLDPTALQRLGTAVQDARAAADTAQWTLRMGGLPAFTVLLLGPVDAGKTTLVQALLGDALDGVGGLRERAGRDTPVPVDVYPGPRLAVRLGIGGTSGSPERWIPAAPTDPDLLQTAGLRRVRFTAPARALVEWGVGITDTPSIDSVGDLTDHLLDEAYRGDVGVLYVVPSRGITEVDAQALELLRGVPVVLVENLRDTELISSRPALDELRHERTATTTALPVAVRRLADDGPERELLAHAVALLRSHRLSRDWAAQAGDTAADARAHVHRWYAERFTALCDERPSDRMAALHLLAELVDLDRLGPATVAFDRALARIVEAGLAVPSTEQLRADLDTRARSAIDQYNVEAARSPVRPRAPERRTVRMQFGEAYARIRGDLLSVLDTMAADDGLRLTNEEVTTMRKVRRLVADDNLEVALLGQFSSGKSSLINALLNVPLGEKFLPAKPRPTTTTVNRIVHSPTPTVHAEWLDDIELQLLAPSAEDHQYKINKDAVRALDSWLRSGAVDPARCSFTSLRADRVPLSEQLRAFEALFRRVAGGDLGGAFLYCPPSTSRPLLTDAATPSDARVREFHGHPEHWARGLDLQAAFSAIERDPGLALQIEELRIGRDHPLLEHLSIIDTPGTDSAIPHHRTTARRAVTDKTQCAVIYCFNGVKPGGLEDGRNLDFLQQHRFGTTDLSRFFFVLTQKSLVPSATAQDEVRAAVRQALVQAGITPSRIYFTDVVNERDGEFADLSRDLDRFVAESKRPLMSSWIGAARSVLEGVRDRHQRRHDDFVRGEHSRLARQEALEAEAEELAVLQKELASSSLWGEPWVRARIATAVAPGISAMDALLGTLTSREAFTGIGSEFDTALADLNDAARRAVHGGCAATVDKLSAELAARLPGRSIAVDQAASAEGFFPAAALATAVDTIVWRTGWERVKGLFAANQQKWNVDVETHRDRLTGRWTASREQGRRTTRETADRLLGQLTAELDRLAAGIAEEIADAARPPSADDDVVALAGRDRTTTWLSRLDALGRLVEGADHAADPRPPADRRDPG